MEVSWGTTRGAWRFKRSMDEAYYSVERESWKPTQKLENVCQITGQIISITHHDEMRTKRTKLAKMES